MKIAIVGAGNAGCAHAFKLSENGHSVALIKTSNTLHEPNFQAIQANGGIWAIDDTLGGKKSFQKIDRITKDIALGLSDAELVLVLTQSLQHKEVAAKVAPYISATTKVLLVIPGNMGSLFFRNELGSRSGILFAEGESTPYDARILEPGMVNILFKNVRNAVSFIPKSRKLEGMELISQLVDTYGFYRENIVESLLHNPNLIVHTIGVIMSANRIELMKGEFWMYRESFSPSIWNLITMLDDEKNRIIEQFGGKSMSYLDACKFRNEEDMNKDSLGVFNSYAEHGGPKGPASLETRYLYEDVAVGLCMLHDLGKKFSIPTPITHSLITIASALVNYNFFEKGRSLKDYKLDTLHPDEIVSLVNS